MMESSFEDSDLKRLSEYIKAKKLQAPVLLFLHSLGPMRGLFKIVGEPLSPFFSLCLGKRGSVIINQLCDSPELFNRLIADLEKDERL